MSVKITITSQAEQFTELLYGIWEQWNRALYRDLKLKVQIEVEGHQISICHEGGLNSLMILQKVLEQVSFLCDHWPCTWEVVGSERGYMVHEDLQSHCPQ